LEEDMTDEPEVLWELNEGVIEVDLKLRGFELKTLRIVVE
jgi:hypothetical protein